MSSIVEKEALHLSALLLAARGLASAASDVCDDTSVTSGPGPVSVGALRAALIAYDEVAGVDAEEWWKQRREAERKGGGS